MAHSIHHWGLFTASPNMKESAALTELAAGLNPAGSHPLGGSLNNCAAPVTRIRKITPQMYQVMATPEEMTLPAASTSLKDAIMAGAIFPIKKAPAPNPITARPVTRPRLSGNQRIRVAIGVT